MAVDDKWMSYVVGSCYCPWQRMQTLSQSGYVFHKIKEHLRGETEGFSLVLWALEFLHYPPLQSLTKGHLANNRGKVKKKRTEKTSAHCQVTGRYHLLR